MIDSRYEMMGYNMDTTCMVVNKFMDKTLHSSLIARRKVGPQTKWRVTPQSFLGWCLTINDCGRAYRGSICGLLMFWIQAAVESFD